MIQVSKPFLGKEELEAVAKVFETGYLGCGEYVEKFEHHLSNYLKKETVCVSSGTAALHLALEALQIERGDEVIVQSLTYVATYQAITAAGAIPVPCDIKKDDLSLDLLDAQRKLSNRTKAIIPVHYGGNPGNLESIYAFAQKNNLRVIEDAAHSFGGLYKDKPIGSIGDIVCFSFDPVKTITCGEGGAIVSGDEHLIEKVREMRMIGMKKERTSPDEVFPAKVHGRGWRYHMNNINAAVGLVQFSKMGDLIKTRRRLIRHYLNLLRDKDYVEIFPFDYELIVPYIFVVILKTANTESVVNKMKSRGIECRVHYLPPHLHPFFKNLSADPLCVVESLYKNIISLPLHSGLSESDIRFVVMNLNEVMGSK